METNLGVAVTGLGIVSSLGVGRKEFWDNLNSGIKISQNNNLKKPFGGSPTASKGEMPLVALSRLENCQLASMAKMRPMDSRRYSRTTLFAIAAIEEALSDSRILTDGRVAVERIGVFGGTTLAGTDHLEEIYKEYLKKGEIKKPHRVLSGSYGAILDVVANHFNLRGMRLMISTACSSSTVVMQAAQCALLEGKVDCAIVFGADPITEVSIAGFRSLGAVTDGRSAPFSTGATGITLGEGAGALVLELADSTKPNAYAWLGGVGVGTDGYHSTAPEPSGRGAREAMESALFQAGSETERVDFVVAHGTGTELNDPSETKAISNLFSRDKKMPIVMSTKAATGHTLGGAGVINAVVACLAIKEKVIPASPGFVSQRKGCELTILENPTKQAKIDGVLANAFGFGGSVASAAFFSKPRANRRPQADTDIPLVITGFGAVTPVGADLKKLEALILEGGSVLSVQSVNQSFTGRRSTNSRAHVDIDKDPFVRAVLSRSRHARRMDRLSVLAYVAASRALVDSKFKITAQNRRRTGILLGNDTGPLSEIQQFYSQIIKEGINSGNPVLFPNTVLNACLGYISMDHLIYGPSAIVAQGEIASGVALAFAENHLKGPMADCDLMLVGGADETSLFQEKGYLDLGQIPTRVEEDGSTAAFSNESKGFFLGEASICAVVETEANRRLRNHPVLACLLGSKMSGKANPGPNRYDPDGESISDCLLNAVKKFGKPDLIVANGTGYRPHDQQILKGIENADLGQIPLYSPLGLFGNIRGTSGALGLFAAATAIKFQRVASQKSNALSVERPVDRVFVLSSGPGGYAVCNTIGRWEKDYV